MQFNKSTITLVATLMATGTHGLPAVLTATACGTAPAGAGPQQPLGSPSADTAAACKKACTKHVSCKSFAFGLPLNAQAPECKLFGVEGAQVPKQDSNIMVFDVACSSVPTDKPTQANLATTMHKARDEPIPPPNSGKPQEHKPQEPKPQEPKPEGPKARGEPIPPPPAGKPQEPKLQEPKPPQPKAQGPKARGEAKVCGAAPAGPAGHAPQPIKSERSVVSADACLALGKATTGCVAVQFSQSANGGAPHCSLFGVAAGVLPPQDGVQSDVVFDVSC